MSLSVRWRALVFDAAASRVLAAASAAWPALVDYARGSAAGETSLEPMVQGADPESQDLAPSVRVCRRAGRSARLDHGGSQAGPAAWLAVFAVAFRRREGRSEWPFSGNIGRRKCV